MARDTITTILERRSIRSYQPKPIPEEDLRAILEAGRHAPSSMDYPPRRHFVLIRDPEIRREIARASSRQMWIADAALIVVGIGRPEGSEKWATVDVAIGLQNMILAAHSLGYGACWIGAFDEDRIKDILDIPPELSVVCLTCIGVPATSPGPKERRPISELFSLDQLGQPYAE